ncbi:ricin-type beta-trefoil lectin protein [Lachnotalea glycerini]|uniref:Ricin-type beta-trefoil lectin protein n=1 Tax=Lachnotalea glycerini TaxID=1763509 RepID=A0A255IPH7_9FIRM|nr:RICIN domain-containing protein [Lachnotalea glycerini]PXV85696.1 ricin-type beta-trefoil lectin protein [Lachnotalea glycerini]RDY30686.1 hypothetical protein CG710_013245 [Lachnotalea glycerini]
METSSGNDSNAESFESTSKSSSANAESNHTKDTGTEKKYKESNDELKKLKEEKKEFDKKIKTIDKLITDKDYSTKSEKELLDEQAKLKAERIANKSLDIHGESQYNCAELMQNDYHGGDNQHFWIIPCKDVNAVKIVAVHSEKVFNVTGGIFNNHTRIQQYYENGMTSQIFKLIKVE